VQFQNSREFPELQEFQRGPIDAYQSPPHPAVAARLALKTPKYSRRDRPFAVHLIKSNALKMSAVKQQLPP